MSGHWTRRQLLAGAGTAAAAAAATGFGVAACGRGDAARTMDLKVYRELQHFVTEPHLTPPKVALSYLGPRGPLQYLFLGVAQSGPGHGGAMIMDTDGQLIWFGPDSPHQSKMDFQCQTYQGKPVLTWFQGQVVRGGHGEGVGVVADSSYRTIATIEAHDGLKVDLHDFVVTPRGTALVTAFRTLHPYDLRPVGGPKDGWLLSGFAQEIDIATGELVFQWDSLDHVGLGETYLKYSGGRKSNKAQPYDYFHINSIADFDDEHLMIGARNTWCAYLVKRSTGEIVWRLNGKHSDFTMGPGARFYWQHDTRWHGDGVFTVFDDGAAPKEEPQSRALVLNVDLDSMLVTLKRQYTNPGVPVLAHAMGNAQLLSDGGMFVGWGTNPYFSEFGPDGKPVLEGTLVKGDPTYRSFIGDWTGTPAYPPKAVAHRRGSGAVVYVSWNGATEVASWQVLAGRTPGALDPVGVAAKRGFETAISVRSTGPHFAVQARDASGRPLATSATVEIA